jgi:cephalosporin hydroxylase
MLRVLSKIWSKPYNPIQERWDYFRNHPATIPAAIALVESVPEDKLKDVDYLEKKLIPSLGLNDENLREQPMELKQFFGTGLHIFQYPNQFARYMVWLAEHAKHSKTYVEIGSRWGGTFIVTCEWLRRLGAPLKTAIAIDPIGETPMVQSYGEHLVRQGIKYEFIKDYSTSHAVRSLFTKHNPDFVLIDGDHSMRGALADHMLVRDSAEIIVHHDISSDACPDTTALWQALKELEAAGFTATEFTDQYPSVDGSFLGIGALKRKAV